MVAPLDIHVVEIHQLIHHPVGPRSPVEDIADDMQAVDGEIPYQLAEVLDKQLFHAGLQDGGQNLIEIRLFVGIRIVHPEGLGDDARKALGKLFPDLRPGVLGRDGPADGHQPVN